MISGPDKQVLGRWDSNTGLQGDWWMISCCYSTERYEGRKGGRGERASPDAWFKIRKTAGVLWEWAIWPPQMGYAHVASSLGTCQGKASNTENYAETTSYHSRLGHPRDSKRWFCGVVTAGVASKVWLQRNAELQMVTKHKSVIFLGWIKKQSEEWWLI